MSLNGRRSAEIFAPASRIFAEPTRFASAQTISSFFLRAHWTGSRQSTMVRCGYKPESVGAIQAQIFNQFPTVTVIDAADILDIIQDVVDRVSLAVRFVAGFAIFGGLVVLASSIAGTRYRRMREAAILKTIGASAAALVRMFCTEFAIVGSIAGLIGGALAGIASSILIRQLLDTPYRFSWIPVVAAGFITALLTVLTGWLASLGILNRKPLDILRQIES